LLNFPVSVLGCGMLSGNLRSRIPATLKVTWIISFDIQVDQGSPCVGTYEPA